MSDFQFLEDPISQQWVVLASRRAKRPDTAVKEESLCPFCIGQEDKEQEVYRVGSSTDKADWSVRVLPNKFPFAPIHEIIIHSPDHHKNIDELPLDQVIILFETYKQRYLTHHQKGQVYIFQNHGHEAGESLPHPHTQLVVIPSHVTLEIPKRKVMDEEVLEKEHFILFCPETSQWPDEVWILPKKRNQTFGQITDREVTELAAITQHLVQSMNERHGNEFPFNYYFYPGVDWYFRFFPRQKSLGGFEMGTGIFVNSGDPKETIEFLKSKFQDTTNKKQITNKI